MAPARDGSERGEVQVDGRVIGYRVVRSKRRRRTFEIALRPREGVVVAAPARASRREVAEAVLRHAGWILRTSERAELEPRRPFADGDPLPFLGETLALGIERGRVRRARAERVGQRLVVTLRAPSPQSAERGDTPQASPFMGEEAGISSAINGAEVRALSLFDWGGASVASLAFDSDSDADIETALERWYRERAAEEFAARVGRWAPEVGAAPSRVLVRAQRRRWGSCAADGSLRFNWRLMLADADIVDYVVVHELAHLLVPSHAQAFWNVVARVLPDHRTLRRRLVEAGPSLYM